MRWHNWLVLTMAVGPAIAAATELIDAQYPKDEVPDPLDHKICGHFPNA